MDRTTARAQAMKLIYEWEMDGDGGEATVIDLLEVTPGEEEYDYMQYLFRGVVDHTDRIDPLIRSFSKGWELERISRVDLAILRLAVFELLEKKVPAGVVINEAVELAKIYSGDKDAPFVNGILGNLSRNGGI